MASTGELFSGVKQLTTSAMVCGCSPLSRLKSSRESMARSGSMTGDDADAGAMRRMMSEAREGPTDRSRAFFA